MGRRGYFVSGTREDRMTNGPDWDGSLSRAQGRQEHHEEMEHGGEAHSCKQCDFDEDPY